MLHLVNLFIFLNWFGDSLDGTLARYRDRQRPRYGFYVDHIIDAFGAVFLIFGLALSGYMSERVAAALLIVFFMLAINRIWPPMRSAYSRSHNGKWVPQKCVCC